MSGSPIFSWTCCGPVFRLNRRGAHRPVVVIEGVLEALRTGNPVRLSSCKGA
jgi:hypothetical protein